MKRTCDYGGGKNNIITDKYDSKQRNDKKTQMFFQRYIFSRYLPDEPDPRAQYRLLIGFLFKNKIDISSKQNNKG